MHGKKLLVILFIMVLLVVLTIAVGVGFLYFLSREPSIQAGTVLELSLGSSVSEIPENDPIAEILSSGGQNLWDLRRGIEAAREDDRISALALEVFPQQMTAWAQIEEIRDMLRSFRSSGKPVYAFLSVDLAMEKDLYLAAGSDWVGMNPTAGVLIDGLMAEIVFMKRTMEMLSVRPQFIQLKEYKSAETYTRQEMTPEIRSMLESVLSDVQERFITTLAQDRQIEVAALRELVHTGVASAEAALEQGLIDGLAYRNDVRQKIEDDLEDLEEYRDIDFDEYLETLPGRVSGARANIAVVGAVGTIVSGQTSPFADLIGGSTMSGELRKLRENDSIDGVILRVNSPGGSAVGSDMIWREVQLLGAEGKPVIVSMSGVAGSGGYYIAMGAERIVTQPSTITGSIGVIFGKFDLSGLYNWLGMDIDRIKLAPNADLLSALSSLTPEQRAQIESWMEDIYREFVQKAANSRGMTYEELEPKAHGRIYTGAQAVENGLADTLGGLGAAINEMKAALELDPDDAVNLELYPKPKTFWEMVAGGDLFKLEKAAGIVDELQLRLRQLETPSPWLMAPDIRIQ